MTTFTMFDQLEWKKASSLAGYKAGDKPTRRWVAGKAGLLDADGKTLLTPAYVDMMLNPRTADDPKDTRGLTEHALGWRRDEVELELADSSLPLLQFSLPPVPTRVDKAKVAALSHTGLLNTRAYVCHREDKVDVGFCINGAYASDDEDDLGFGEFIRALHRRINDLFYRTPGLEP